MLFYVNIVNTVILLCNIEHEDCGTSSSDIMTVGRSLLERQHTYLLPTDKHDGSHNLCKFTEDKDLGVFIDSDLRFENHILSKVKTCNRILGLMKQNFKNIDLNGFLLLYKSSVRSYLEYT